MISLSTLSYTVKRVLPEGDRKVSCLGTHLLHPLTNSNHPLPFHPKPHPSKHVLVKPNTYLIPHATMELGLNYMRAGAFTEARQWFDECKTYSSYALETIVHFRIHTAIRTMSLQTKAEKKKKLAAAAAAQALDSIKEGEEEAEGEGEEATKVKGAPAAAGLGSSLWSALSRRWTGGNSSAQKTAPVEEEEEEEEVEEETLEQAPNKLKTQTSSSSI